MQNPKTPRTKKSSYLLRLLALAVVVVLTAAACSSDGGATVASAVTQAESDQAAPADGEAMDDEEAMADDAMSDDDDAMADEDAMSDDDDDDDDAMADEDAMSDDDDDDAMADEDAMSDDDDDDAMADDAMSDEGDAMADDAMSEAHGSLDLAFAGLESLGDAAVYEGWVIVDGVPISTGRFDIDRNGDAVAEDGGDVFIVPADVDAAAVVISIEPADDLDPAPADTKVLGGDVIDGVANLTIAHPAALGTDFATASGKYILGTPTDGDGNNELSGVWFIDLPLSAGLNLPELPAGWVYEGWAVIDGVPVSTGQFTDPAAADNFDGFSGDQGGPPFPGEDFIVNAPDGVNFPTDLTQSTIVISVEPAPDDGPAPFAIKPLVSEVADGLADHVVQDLGAGPAAPTGTATISG